MVTGAVRSGVTSLKVKQEYKRIAGPSVRAAKLEREFCGSILDRAVIGYLHINGICVVSLGKLQNNHLCIKSMHPHVLGTLLKLEPVV